MAVIEVCLFFVIKFTNLGSCESGPQGIFDINFYGKGNFFESNFLFVMP